MRKTRFILSLDCEGKWGVADLLSPPLHRSLSDDRLADAYRSIVDVLDEHAIPATFAFVGLFGEPAETFKRLAPALTSLASQSGYLRAALADIREGSRQGWHGGWALDMVGSAAASHEIALHGITHVPWSSKDRDFFIEELALLDQLTSTVRDAKTFVYPRNDIAHVDLLKDAGLLAFRAAPPNRSRAAALLSELNVREEPQAPVQPISGVVPIPPGFFVNWQHGLRRAIPFGVSVARLEHLLRSKDGEGQVVHFWLHPENVASAPATLELLRRMIRRVAQHRDRGDCVVQTQLEFARGQLAGI